LNNFFIENSIESLLLLLLLLGNLGAHSWDQRKPSKKKVRFFLKEVLIFNLSNLYITRKVSPQNNNNNKLNMK
jgi:hypothetical protein